MCQVHHLGEHASHTSQLNAVLEKMRWDPELKHLAKMGIDELLHNVDSVPERESWTTAVLHLVCGRSLRVLCEGKFTNTSCRDSRRVVTHENLFGNESCPLIMPVTGGKATDAM